MGLLVNCSAPGMNAQDAIGRQTHRPAMAKISHAYTGPSMLSHAIAALCRTPPIQQVTRTSRNSNGPILSL